MLEVRRVIWTDRELYGAKRVERDADSDVGL